MPHLEEVHAAPATQPEAPDRSTMVDRSEDARRIVGKLLSVRGQVVILHGPERSGKTRLVRGWVMPAIPEGTVAFYGKCAPELPDQVEGPSGPVPLVEAIRGNGFVFLDFNRFLATSMHSRRQAAVTLFTDRTATLVLIVNEQSLAELLAFRSIEPGVMDHLIETGEMSLGKSLQQVDRAADGKDVSYSPELLGAIEADLETFSPQRRSLTPELVVLIDAHFRLVTRAEQSNIRHFENIGRLRGILEAWLERKLAQAPLDLLANESMAPRAVLEEVVGSRLAGREFDSGEPARRLAIDPSLCVTALSWLKAQGIAGEDRPGVLHLAPIHLEQPITEALERKRRDTREVREALALAVASWSDLRVVLPPDRFREIHDVRTDVSVTEEEAAFLVQCALRSVDPQNKQARYWVRRIARAEQQISALFVGLFDSEPAVRARAAALLAGYDLPEVRGQLYRTAVEDPASEVRCEAVTALSGMQVDEFWEPLACDARLPSSRYRVAAVEALRLFRETRSVDLLKNLVSDATTPSDIRGAAIRTLGCMDYEHATEALVGIAVRDEDEDDRAHAAEALASAKTGTIAAVAFSALRRSSEAGPASVVARGPWWLARRTGAAPLALLTGLLNIFIHGFALLAIRRYRSGFAILGVQMAFVAATTAEADWAPLMLWGLLPTFLAGSWIPTRVLVEGRCRLQVRLGTFQGFLALVLYLQSVFTTFFLIHGLAHLLAGRARAAAKLFALQLLGVACFVFYYLDREELYQLTKVGNLYWGLGWVLWVATWLWDVVMVGLDNLLSPGRAVIRQRTREAYARILTNLTAARSLLEFAESSNSKDRKWAASVLRHASESISPELWIGVIQARGPLTPRFVDRALRRARREETLCKIQALWMSAQPDMRRRIFSILAWNFTERSLECLRGMWNYLGFGYKLRYYTAWLAFRVRLVPAFVWAPTLLVLPMAASLAWHGWVYGRKPSQLALDFVSSEAAQLKEPQRAVKFAKFVTETYPDEVQASLVAGLGRILSGRGWEVSVGASQTLADLLRSPKMEIRRLAREQLQQNLPYLEGELLPSDFTALDAAMRRSLLSVLEAMATPASAKEADENATAPAVEALRKFAKLKFIEPPAERVNRRGSSVGASKQREFEGLQIEAVRSLARIPSSKAAQALQDLALTSGPLQKIAETEKKKIASVWVETVRTAYVQSEYERALESGQRMLRLLPPDEKLTQRAELLELLGRSSWGLALAEDVNLRRVAELDRTAVSYFENARGIRSLDPESLRILASLYLRMAERLIPGDLSAAMINVEKAIQADPEYSQSYRLITDAHHREGKDKEAIVLLERARRQHPGHPLPVLAQMYVYHEYLSATDSAAYQHNYSLFQELQKPEYRSKITNQDELEAGFVEASFTTGRYDQAVDRGIALLQRTKVQPDVTVAVPVGIIVYAALVLRKDYGRAAEELDSFESTLKSLPKDYKEEWSYQGTLWFIRTRNAPEPLKSRLTELVDAVAQGPANVAPAVLQANREALKTSK